jgi:hypothetical protein
LCDRLCGFFTYIRFLSEVFGSTYLEWFIATKFEVRQESQSFSRPLNVVIVIAEGIKLDEDAKWLDSTRIMMTVRMCLV